MTNITLLRKDLNEAAQKVQSVVPSRPTLSILSSLLVTLENFTLTLTATDVRMGMSVTIATDSKEKLTFVVLARPFIDLIKTLHAEQISLEIKDGELTLKCGTVTSVMQTSSADEYPAFPKLDGKAVNLSKVDIEDILAKVTPSVTPDSARPLLTGVLFDPLSPPLAVATDGFRLSMFSLADQEMLWEERAVVPAKFFAEVGKVLTDKKVSIIYSFDQKTIMAQLAGTSVFSRVLEGEYPPYEKIIPTSSSATLVLLATDLLEQVKRAVIFSKESMNAVQIVATAQEVLVKAQSPTFGQFSGVVQSAKFTGTDITIAFNSKYLLDYLSVVGDEEISIAMTDSLKPVLITTLSNNNWRYVVMPFKLNG